MFWGVLFLGGQTFQNRFDGASGMTILATLLSDQSAANHANWRRGSWAFEQAIICHQCKWRNSRRNGRQSDDYSDGWWLKIRQTTTTKRRAQHKALVHHPAWAWTFTATPTKRHMMPLGLVPRVRTQGLGWPCQEVHHCATHFMVARREKNGHLYTALTTKLLTN